MTHGSGNGDRPSDLGGPAQRLFIEGYGDGGFRIGGRAYAGSVIVLPDRVLSWEVDAAADVATVSLQPLLDAADAVDLLLLGTGARMLPVPADVRAACRAAGITVEPMDSGAAARTFNVLLAEDRRVAAALIVV